MKNWLKEMHAAALRKRPALAMFGKFELTLFACSIPVILVCLVSLMFGVLFALFPLVGAGFFLSLFPLGLLLTERQQRLEKERLEGLARFSAECGLSLRTEADPELARQFEFLHILRKGSNLHAEITLEGIYKGHAITAMDYCREEGSGSSRRAISSSLFVIRLPISCPQLLIFPESAMDRIAFTPIAKAMGFTDIDFDSVEFSRAFIVHCLDKRFAHAVCHPGMMELLLADRWLVLEFHRDCLAISHHRVMSAGLVRTKLDQIAAIRDQFPRHLLADAERTVGQ